MSHHAQSFSPPQVASLNDVLERRAKQTPDKVAYRFVHEHGDEALTYSELYTRSSALAATLQQRGTQRTPVLLVYPSGLEFVVALFACFRAGAIAAPVSVARKGAMRPSMWQRLSTIATNANATLMLSSKDTAADLMTAAPELLENFRWFFTDDATHDQVPTTLQDKPAPHEYALVQYSSGSTAEPKGAVITHEQLLFNLAMLQEAFRQTEDSIIVNWVPHFHDLGLIVHICHAMYVGASCITMDPLTFVARPLSWLETISKYRGTFSGAPNFGYDICANKVTAAQAQSLDLRSWEVAVNAGEPVRAQTIERFSSQFALSGFPVETMSPAYGLAEATAIVTGDRGFFPRGLRCLVAAELNRGRVVELPQHAPEGRWVVGCGRSVGGEVIAIVDPDNRTRCPSGTVGEIWVSSRAVASGYWQKPVETETTFRARIAEEAASDERTYLRTGDLGFVLDEQLYITGRLKDTLVVHGAVHYPQDIEQSVEAAHPAFRRSGSTAAFQVDAGDGEERLVVLQEVEPNQVTPEAFATCVQAIRNVVADHHGLFVNTVCLLERGGVLKTTSGKIRRAACRTALLDNKLPILVRSDTTPTETSSNDPSLTRDKLLTLVPADRVERLESYVLQQLATALQLAPDQARGLRPELSLLSQGMDSLMATTLAERIQKALGVTLRLEDLLLGASAAQTAMKIAELLEDEEETLI